MRKSIFFILLLFPAILFGQLDQVRVWTKTLCSPEMHGRGYVSSGDSLAAEYLAAEYKKIGLTPIPGNENMFQSFQFPVNTFPKQMKVQLNNQILRPGIDYIVDPSSGTFTGELNSVFLDGKSLYSIENLNVLLLKNKEMNMNAIVADLSTLKGDSLKIVKSRLHKWNSSISIVELSSSKFTWSVATEAENFPYIILRDSLWENQKIKIDIFNKLIPNHTARNVIAYLPAKKKTTKTLFFSAHYDHLGRMGAETYFPGGNDNASGSALLLSLASYFKNHPSKYNLVFVGFAGEEAGLIGSHYYVSHPLLPLSNIKFLINLDIMGSGEEGITAVNASLFPKEFKKLKKINAKHDLLKTVNSRGPAANSDHYFFSENGVPCFFIYTMGPNKNYHDIFDTYDALSFAEFTDLSELIKLFIKKM
ncbi:MAG: M28 family metallopeptidase [Bacteroidota bacterium]